MMKQIFLNFVHLFMNVRECLGKGKQQLTNEEVIADLYTYLEHLQKKSAEMEGRIEKCSQQALFHKNKAQQEATKNGKERESNRAILFIKDKRRLQDEQDKVMKFTHVIRQQIDSLTTSELDSIMVEAMRQYNMTATQMGLPDRTREIEELGNDLQDRFSEATQLQQTLGDATNPSSLASVLMFGSNQMKSFEEDEEDLRLELEALGAEEASEKSKATTLPEPPPSKLPSDAPLLEVEKKEEEVGENKTLVPN